MTLNEIKSHKLANKKLDLIRVRIIDFIKKNINKVSEKDVCDFILKEFEKENMTTDKAGVPHFVVINEHTDDTHWSKTTLKPSVIREKSLIMIDYWAKMKNSSSIFADITWMFYVGKKIPDEIEKTFDKVLSARAVAINYIKKELKSKRFPRAKEIDKAVREYFNKYGLDKFFTHRTGHSLGNTSCHGKHFRISRASKKIIGPNILFTIEPGIYFKGEFGIRSEVNCYITNDYKMIITGAVQNNIIKI